MGTGRRRGPVVVAIGYVPARSLVKEKGRGASLRAPRAATSVTDQPPICGSYHCFQTGLHLISRFLRGDVAVDDLGADAPQFVLQVRFAARQDLV